MGGICSHEDEHAYPALLTVPGFTLAFLASIFRAIFSDTCFDVLIASVADGPGDTLPDNGGVGMKL